jgi:cell wall-associated NlpC family hydrolase
MIPAWVGGYVGLPWRDKGRGPDAFDCWGLAREVLTRHYGAPPLPDYGDAYRNANDLATVTQAIQRGLLQGWERCGAAAEGRLAIVQLAGVPWHCGVMVGEDMMLHALERANVVVESIRTLTWARRIEGFYRYAA